MRPSQHSSSHASFPYTPNNADGSSAEKLQPHWGDSPYQSYPQSVYPASQASQGHPLPTYSYPINYGEYTSSVPPGQISSTPHDSVYPEYAHQDTGWQIPVLSHQQQMDQNNRYELHESHQTYAEQQQPLIQHENSRLGQDQQDPDVSIARDQAGDWYLSSPEIGDHPLLAATMKSFSDEIYGATQPATQHVTHQEHQNDDQCPLVYGTEDQNMDDIGSTSLPYLIPRSDPLYSDYQQFGRPIEAFRHDNQSLPQESLPDEHDQANYTQKECGAKLDPQRICMRIQPRSQSHFSSAKAAKYLVEESGTNLPDCLAHLPKEELVSLVELFWKFVDQTLIRKQSNLSRELTYRSFSRNINPALLNDLQHGSKSDKKKAVRTLLPIEDGQEEMSPQRCQEVLELLQSHLRLPSMLITKERLNLVLNNNYFLRQTLASPDPTIWRDAVSRIPQPTDEELKAFEDASSSSKCEDKDSSSGTRLEDVFEGNHELIDNILAKLKKEWKLSRSIIIQHLRGKCRKKENFVLALGDPKKFGWAQKLLKPKPKRSRRKPIEWDSDGDDRQH